MIENIIECHALTKKYKHQYALQHLNLSIAKGEIFGLIGQNGAGKSTMMKLLAGLIHPSEGDFTLFGKVPSQDPYVYRRIGTLIEEPGLYLPLSAMENMRTKALMLGCDRPHELKAILQLCGLNPDNKKKVKTYSLGMKQRLGLALAMIGNPEILILDEPVNGLDPQGINDMRKALLRLNKEKNVTIILSSHILEELSKIATSYGIIKEGVLIKQISKENLEDSMKEYCQLIVDDAKKTAVILEESAHLQKYKVVDANTLHIFDVPDTSEIVELLVKQQIRIYEIMNHKQNLEEYFLQISGGKEYVE